MLPASFQSSLQTLLETSFDAAFIIDEAGTIVDFNQIASQLFEYSKQELATQNISLLLADAEQNALDLRRLATETTSHTVSLKTRTGRVFEASCRVSAFDDVTTVRLFLLVVRETQQSPRVLEELLHNEHHRAVVLQTASRVALDILSNRTGIEALRHIADAARILAGARYAALGVAHAESATREGLRSKGLREFITVGLTPDEEAAIGALPHGRGVLGLLLERDAPLRIDKLSEHPASVGFPLHHPPMESFLGVPIRRGESTLGSLYLTNKQGGGTFSEADEVAVQALSDYAAVAIYNLHRQEKQRDLVRALISAQEEERRAVAYDLHDGLTQYVMASHAHLEAFSRAHENGNEDKAARELNQGLKYLKEAVVESRRLINGLRSLALDDLGLAGALEQLLNEEKERTGWEVELSHNIAGRRFDKTLETGVYRLVQEALTNARKHARSSRIRVLVRLSQARHNTRLRLEVRDWGCGFSPEEKLNEAGRVGLNGMMERTHLLSGALRIRSSSEGTRIVAEFPILDFAEEDEAVNERNAHTEP